MNKQLTKLYRIAQKDERLFIGLMSGTSLDGLDIALCNFSGSGYHTKLKVLEFTTLEYSEDLQQRLRKIQSWEKTDTREITYLHSRLGNWYGEKVLEALNSWKVPAEEIDAIASHGQTVFHAPSDNSEVLNSTFQIVDGDHVAESSGIITISDFRQKHTAVGGNGAPLAGIFDEVLFRSTDKNRMLLNLGGIANITWLPSKKSGKEILATDTGPANTLINEAMQKHYGHKYDDEGKIAASGKVHSELVKYALLEPYFRKPFPKTTGQEDFKLSYIEELMEGHQIKLDAADLVASLTAITVQSISRAVNEIAEDEEFECFISGGGIYNTTMMSSLKNRLPKATFENFENLGISPDAKEAAMMAFFANDLLVGNGFPIKGVTDENIHLGKISLPH